VQKGLMGQYEGGKLVGVGRERIQKALCEDGSSQASLLPARGGTSRLPYPFPPFLPFLSSFFQFLGTVFIPRLELRGGREGQPGNTYFSNPPFPPSLPPFLPPSRPPSLHPCIPASLHPSPLTGCQQQEHGKVKEPVEGVHVREEAQKVGRRPSGADILVEGVGLLGRRGEKKGPRRG
jgi:hypothetical protein